MTARLRRVFAVASLGWSAVYALRAGTQWALYQEDAPVLMAIAKVSLGWPLTVVAVALTLAAVRRAVHSRPTAAVAAESHALTNYQHDNT